MSVTNGGQLQAITQGKGDAGNVLIDARGSVSFDGRSRDDRFPSAAFSNVEQTGVGQGGDIKISAETLSVTNGGQLQAITQGKGDAGNVLIDARGSVSFDGRSRDDRFLSAAFSNVQQTGVGQGGNVRISADNVSITNGAKLTANSCIVRTSAKAGSFTITGSGGLPNRPGDVSASLYSTGDVRDIPGNSTSWKKGDPIVEPTGVYRLSNGRLVMSRECL